MLGVMWALWHLPLLWTPGRVLHGHPFWLFLLDLVAESMIFTWVFLHTRGSVLIAMLLHAGLNVFTVPAVVPALPLLAVPLEWVVVAVLLACARRTFSRPVRDPEVLPREGAVVAG